MGKKHFKLRFSLTVYHQDVVMKNKQILMCPFLFPFLSSFQTYGAKYENPEYTRVTNSLLACLDLMNIPLKLFTLPLLGVLFSSIVVCPPFNVKLLGLLR